MDYAQYRRPGPIETSFSSLLQRAMRGKLFPDIIQHYERVEMETRAMIISDWMMTFYTEVLFKVRSADASQRKLNARLSQELLNAATETQKRNSRLQLFAGQSLKDHFNYAVQKSDQHMRRREDDYQAFLDKRRELNKREEASKILQRCGRGKLWRVLLFVSKATRRDGLTTRSIEWEHGFNQLVLARQLIANAAYKKQVTDSAVDFARRGASDDRTSLSTAKKAYLRFHQEQKEKSISSNNDNNSSQQNNTYSYNASPKKEDVVPFRLLAAPWSWTIRRDQLEERAKITLEFIIAEEKLNRWAIWKIHIRDLVLKQQAIPRNRVEFEMRKVWKTIEVESIALSQRSEMHKEFLKSLTSKYHQYRRERAELKEALIRKGVLFPDEGVWDYDLVGEPDFNFGEGLSPFRQATDRQKKKYRDENGNYVDDDSDDDKNTDSTKDTLRHGTDTSSSMMQGNQITSHNNQNNNKNPNNNNNNAFGNLGNSFNRPGSASAHNSRPGSSGPTDNHNNNNNNIRRQDSLIPAGTNPFSRPNSGANSRPASSDTRNNNSSNLQAQDSVFAEILEQKRKKEERAKWKRFEKDQDEDGGDREDYQEDEDEVGSGLSSIDSKASIRAKKQVWI